MKKSVSFKFWPALSSLALFAGLCAIAAYWALQLLVPSPAVAPTETQTDQRGSGDGRALAEMFGVPATAATVVAANVGNIQVLGVTAGSDKGSAILAVDGAPGRFFAIGATVSEGIKLVAVKRDAVVIERSGARSELPAPARANLSVLTSGVGKTRQSSSAPPPPPFGAAAAAANPPPQNFNPGQAPPAGAPGGPPLPGQIAPFGQNVGIPPGHGAAVNPVTPNIPNSGSVNNTVNAPPMNIPGALAPPPAPFQKSF